MSQSAPLPEPTRDPRDRFKLPVGRLLLFILFALIFVPPVWPPDVDLDPSWRMALAWVHQQGFQHGQEFVFTAGPLGFLASQTYTGLYFGLTMFWNAALAIGSALFVLQLLRGYSVTRQAFIALFFLLVVRGNFDQHYMMMLVLAGWQLFRPEPPGARRLVLTAAVMAVFSLVKFTLSLQSTVILVAFCGHALLTQRRRDAAVFAGSFAAVYLALWVACGQNPLNLPAYWWYSLDISVGYGDTMSLPPPPVALACGLVILAAMILYGGFHLLAAGDRMRAAAQLLTFASATYLTWKHGFVRADGHMLHFLTFGPLIAILHPFVFDPPRRWRWVPVPLLLATAVAATVAYRIHFPIAAVHPLTALNDDLRAKINLLLHPRAFAEQARLGWVGSASKYRLVEVPRTVGQDTVDVLAHYQGVALLNGFNYLPRPVPQSYSAYTPRLAALNAAHYESPRGPQWVLQRIRSIDERFPSLDDAPLNLALVRRYGYVLQDGEYLLWRRLPEDAAHTSFKPTPGEMKSTRLNEVVALGELENSNLWLRLDVRPTLSGRLRAFFYQPAPIHIEVEDTTGRVQRFRLLPKVAREGFLFNPLLRDQFDWLRFINDLKNARIRWFRVAVDREYRKYYRREVGYAFDVLPPPPVQDERVRGRERERALEHLLAEVGGFRTHPAGIDAGAPIGGAVAGGQPAVLVHAPSEMLFELPANATTLKARYGLSDGSYTGDARVAGAGVQVVFQAGTTTKVLFERWLDPLKVPEDRGLHDLTVDLKGLGAGHLYVRNFIRDTNAWAWTVWRDLEILPAPPESPDRRVLSGNDYLLKRYGRFADLPMAIRGATSLIAVNVHGLDMVQVHAPSEVAMQIPAGAKRAVGRYALRLPDDLNTANTNGAEFVVLWKSGDDERILHSRFLDPVAIPADRGPHNFEVGLEGLPSNGTLVLRIKTGPNGDATADWSCWSDIAVGNPAPLPEVTPPTEQSAASAGPTSVATSVFAAAGFRTIPASAGALVPPGASRLGDSAAVQMHAPSLMIFPLGPEPVRVRARFGLTGEATANSDGVDYVIEWQPPQGPRKVLLRRSLLPRDEPADAGPQVADVSLAGLSGGQLRLRVEAGPSYNSAYDWSTWADVEVEGAVAAPESETIPFTPLAAPVPRAALRPKLSTDQMEKLKFTHSPVEWSGVATPTLTVVNDVTSLQIHAPSAMLIPMPTNARELSGYFGFPEPAYKSARPTDGADFYVEWIGADGETRVIFHRFLDPRRNIDDVGLQYFKVPLHELPPGDLRFRTDAGPAKDLASDWTCWQGLTFK